MHEKIEMKTNTRAVAVTAGWPMALALLVLGGMVLLLFPLREGWPMLLLLAGVIGLTFLWCLKLYLGTYIFLPPTEIKGARIIARLGRNEEVEISGVLRDEIIIKQGWLEKKLEGDSVYELAEVDPLTMAAGTYSHPDRGSNFDERSKEYPGKEDR